MRNNFRCIEFQHGLSNSFLCIVRRSLKIDKDDFIIRSKKINMVRFLSHRDGQSLENLLGTK